MKTSNILIAAAVIGAGYLYKNKKEGDAPVAVTVPSAPEAPGSPVATTRPFTVPGNTGVFYDPAAPKQTMTASMVAVGSKVVVMTRRAAEKYMQSGGRVGCIACTRSYARATATPISSTNANLFV